MRMNNKKIQTFQNEFCMVNHIYCSCLSGKQEAITTGYGSTEEWEFLNRYIDPNKPLDMVNRFKTSKLEEVIEEELECGFIKMASVAIRVEVELVAVWNVFGVLEEKLPSDLEVPESLMRISQKDFYHVVKLLYICSQQYFETYVHLQEAREKLEKSGQDKKRIEQELMRSEVMNYVVQMLESEQEFGLIVDDVLRYVCEYMKISGGSLLRIEQENDTVDMICEWRASEVASRLDKFQQIPKENLPFWNGKPYVVSSNSIINTEFQEFFEREYLKAGIFLPIEVSGQVQMYLCFTEEREERIWDITDIKFLSNLKKLIQSILTKRISKNSLTGSYVSLEAILENIGCGICVKDIDYNNILFANEGFRNCFKQSIADGTVRQLFTKPKHYTQENTCSEFYVEEEDKWFDIHYTEIIWVNGKRVSLYTVYDITGSKRYQKKIERQANNDFLTGLYNRMRCEQDLQECIKQTKAVGGEGALLYMDLDDFKHINDGLGHRYGDVLLKAIAHSLQRIKGIENTCYRMGGDEFIIILNQYQYTKMNRILQEIEEIFSKPWFLKGADYYCTMSMGIVRFPSDGEDVSELIQKADLALYEAKKAGKNRCEFYTNNVKETSIKRLDLEKNMRNATQDSCNEFEVYYQPIFDMSANGVTCIGAEALIRWNSKSLGYISPAEFIPLAEYLGLINPIGNHVLRQACEDCKHWNDMGHPDYKVNVNLSVVQLLQNDIVENVAQVLRETGVEPSNLVLEVTESLAVNDMARMKRILSKIKSLGVRVALDDFGTGYSSLNHIREMPIDIVKIDRCFINGLGKDEFAEVFIKVVGELADTLDMNLCVEGVETDAQYQKLQKMRIPLIQGFYFDTPLRIDEFERKYVY